MSHPKKRSFQLFSVVGVLLASSVAFADEPTPAAPGTSPAPTAAPEVASEPTLTAPKDATSQPVVVEATKKTVVVEDAGNTIKETTQTVELAAAPEPAKTEMPPKMGPPAGGPAWYDYITLSPYLVLRYTLDIGNFKRSQVSVHRAGIKAAVNYGPFLVVVDPQIRVDKNRKTDLSNVLIRAAFIQYRTPVEGLSLAGGILHNRMGYFWDHSFYGTVPAISGMKINQDYNLQLQYSRNYGLFGINTWFQVSPMADGYNITVALPPKLAKLKAPADAEVATGYKKSWTTRLRVEPKLTFGDFSIIPGLGMEYGLVVKSKVAPPPAPPAAGKPATPPLPGPTQDAVGTQFIGSGDLTLMWKGMKLIGEVTAQRLSKEVSFDGQAAVNRMFYNISTFLPVYKQTETDWLRQVGLTAGFSYGDFRTEQFGEYIARTGIEIELYKRIKLYGEWSYWTLTGDQAKPFFNGLELLIDASF